MFHVLTANFSTIEGPTKNGTATQLGRVKRDKSIVSLVIDFEIEEMSSYSAFLIY